MSRPWGAAVVPPLIAILPAYVAGPRHPAPRDLAGSSCPEGVLEDTWQQIGAHDLTSMMGELACGHIPWEECPDPFWAVEPFVAAH